MSPEVRLLVLNCEFPPLGGGAATATRHLLEQLENFPVETTLVTAAQEGPFRMEGFSKNCRIDFVPVAKKELHYWTNRELLAYAVAASRHVRALLGEGARFDVCHAFFTLPAGAVAMRFSKEFPYVVSLRGSDVPGYSGRYGWLYSAVRPFFRRVWRRAGAVVANSASLAQLAAETAPELGIAVIPNGVDTDAFHPGPPRKSASTVLTVARLVPRKDVASVIRATSILKKKCPGVRLIVVGDGPEAPRLRALAADEAIAEGVEFRPYVPREDMPCVYREADVFVTMSRREGMSNTVLEAIASGLPIVATQEALAGIDVPGADTVPSGDFRAAAAAAERLLLDREARREASRVSRAAAGAYSWRAMAERYFEVYTSIIAAKEGGAT